MVLKVGDLSKEQLYGEAEDLAITGTPLVPYDDSLEGVASLSGGTVEGEEPPAPRVYVPEEDASPLGNLDFLDEGKVVSANLNLARPSDPQDVEGSRRLLTESGQFARTLSPAEFMRQDTPKTPLTSDTPATVEYFGDIHRANLAKDVYHDMSKFEKTTRSLAAGALIDLPGLTLAGTGTLLETLARHQTGGTAVVNTLVGEYVRGVGTGILGFREAVAGFDSKDVNERDIFVAAAEFVGLVLPLVLAAPVTGTLGIMGIMGTQAAEGQRMQQEAHGVYGTDAGDLAIAADVVVQSVLGTLKVEMVTARLPQHVQNAVLRRAGDALLVGLGGAGVDVLQNVASVEITNRITGTDIDYYEGVDFTTEAGGVFLAETLMRGGAQIAYRNRVGVSRQQHLVNEGVAQARDLDGLKAVADNIVKDGDVPMYRKFLQDSGAEDIPVFMDREAAEALLAEFTQDAIDADPLLTLLQKKSAELAEKDIVGDQEKLQFNGVDFVDVMAKSEHYNTIKDSLTTSAEAVSMAQQGEWVEGLREAYNEMLATSEAEIPLRAEFDAVKEQVAESLRETGLYSDAQAESNATIVAFFVAHVAQKDGISIAEAFETAGFVIEGGADFTINPARFTGREQREGIDVPREGEIGEGPGPLPEEAPVLNIGLDIPEAAGGGKLTVEQVTAVLAEYGVEPVHLRVHRSDTEDTAVIATDGELTPEQLAEISERLQQEAVAQRKKDGSGNLEGPSAHLWGSFDPSQFVMMDGSRASEIGVQLAQGEGGRRAVVRGMYSLRGHGEANSDRVITLSKDATNTTFMHEFAHHMREYIRHRAEYKEGFDAWTRDNADAIYAEFLRQLENVGIKGAKFKSEGFVQDFLEKGTTGHEVADKIMDTAIHELFARAFEGYIARGEAPHAGLRKAFQELAVLFMQVLRALRGATIESKLRTPIDGEITALFDRLLTAHESLNQGLASAEYQAAFRNEAEAARAGLNKEQYAEYKKSQEGADEKIQATLREKLTKEITRLFKGRWAEEKQVIIDRILPGIREEEVNQVREMLLSGKFSLDRAAVKEMVGESYQNKRMKSPSTRVPAALNRMTKTGGKGLHPDVLAEMIDYRPQYVTPEDGAVTRGMGLLIDLIRAPSAEAKANIQAESVMVKRHGDILSREAINAEVDKALQSEEMGRKILGDVRALRLGKKGPPAEVMKQIAGEQLATFSLREIRPDAYRRAQIKAAMETQKALSEGDVAAARAAKERQLMNFYLEKEANRLRESLVKQARDTKRYRNPKVRAEIQKARGGHIDIIDQILFRYALHKGGVTQAEVRQRNESIESWIAERTREHGEEFMVSDEILSMEGQVHWRDVPTAELQSTFDSLRNIEHQARRANGMEVAGEKVEYETMVRRALEAAKKLPDKFKPTRESSAERSKWSLRGLTAMSINIHFLARDMDAGEVGGAWHQILAEAERKAFSDSQKMWVDVAAPVAKALRDRDAETVARHNSKYTKDINGESVTFSGLQAIVVALNVGNESNLRRLLLGERWARPGNPEDISIHNPHLQEVIGVLTKEDWDLVQTIGRQMEKLYDPLSQIYQHRTGVTPTKIKTHIVETQFGDIPGWYFPMKTDVARKNQMLADEMDLAGAEQGALEAEADYHSLFNRNSVHANVSASATQERTGSTAPLLWSPDIITGHFNETIHYIAYHDFVRQTNKFLRDPRIRNSIENKLGKEYYVQFTSWLERVAKMSRPRPELNGLDRFFTSARNGTTLAVLGGSLTTFIRQIPGWSIGAREIGAKYMLLGTKMAFDNAGSANEKRQWMIENSHIMGSRYIDMNREFSNEAARQLSDQSKYHGYLADARELAMRFVAFSQVNFVDIPTWYGAYYKSFDVDGNHERAVSYADTVLEMSQGSGREGALSAILGTEVPALRLMTMFMTWFGTVAQQQRSIVRHSETPADIAFGALWVIVLPVLLDMLVLGRLFPDEDEEGGDYAARLAGEFISYTTAGLPVVRDAVSYASGRMGIGAGGRSFSLTPVESVLASALKGATGTAMDLASGDVPSRKNIEGLTKGVGLYYNVPATSQMWRFTNEIMDFLEEGDDFSIIEFAYGKRN